MNFFGTDLVWLVLILITLNLAIVAIVRSEERFWVGQSVVWFALLGGLLFTTVFSGDEVVDKEVRYHLQTDEGSKQTTEAARELDAAKANRQLQTRRMIRLIGLQTLICAVFQAAGARSTARPQFRAGARSFFLIFLIYLVLELYWYTQAPASATML